jgi:phosphorylcholine metabolism protein LicD
LIKILKSIKRVFQNLNQKIAYGLRGFRDYYFFPFDVSKPLNNYSNSVLVECTQVLDREKVNYFLCDGTILGIYRDGRLIPHDNDIDVSIFGDFDVDILKNSFKERGYKIGRELYYKRKIQQLTVYSKHEVIFDMCFWRDQDDGYAYHYVPEVKNGRRQKLGYFNKSLIEYQGHLFPTFINIECWLQEQYGDSWHIPESSKGDWRLGLKDIIE